MINYRSYLVRLTALSLPLTFLLSVAFPRYALSWTKEVVEAAHAVANGTATPKQQAIAFQNNKAINEMALKGEIPKNVYRANQSSFETLNNRFVGEAATENGLTARLQQTPPDKISQPGTDTDVLVEKGKSGKPITSEQVANTTKSYNRKVEQFLKDGGVPTSGNQNWARKTDTDFMPVPSHTTPEEFAKIAAETNKRGGTMYKDPKAAEVEAQMRSGKQIEIKDANAYVKEMQTLANDKLHHANELDRQARDIRRTSPQNEAQAKSLEAEAQLKRSQAGKYIERIDKVGGKLAEQHGVGASKPQGPAAESVSAVSKTRGPETARQAATVGTLGEHSLTNATKSYAENLANIAKTNPELAKAAQAGIAETAASLSPSQKGELIENLKSTHGDGLAKGVAKEMRVTSGKPHSTQLPDGSGLPKTVGKPTNEVSSRKPTGPAEPSGKAPIGEPSGQTAGKASPEPAAKGTKPSVEPSSVGKTRTAESSAPKGERGPVDKSATNKPSTPEEWRRWNEQRVPESVKQKGPGIPDSNTGRDFVEGLPKNPTDPSPPAKKPFGSGMTPEQKAIYDKLIKEGVPHRAPPDGPAPPEPSGSKTGRTPSESITEPAGKSGKTTPEPTAKGDPTPTESSGKTTAAKTTAEPTGKPAGQTSEAPKGKGPVIDAPDAPKGRVADAPDAKPRVSGAPAPKMGAMRKGLNVVGEGMNAVGTLADAEDFKEAAKKGDVEGMMKTGARGVAGLTPLGSAALGAKDTYDMAKERRGDRAEAEKAIADANKRNEEAYELQSAKALRGAGLSPDQVKQIMEAKARGDEGPLNSKFKELNLRPPERIREAGPKADDTAWERTKDVAGGVATQGQKAGKFLNDARKDLTEIGTGMLDKGTRDEVAGQVKENVSLENIKAGLEAHGSNKKADADRAAARDELKNKLIEKGASRDEAEKAVREWDKGDRRAVNELRERIKKENSKNLPGETYDPRRDANFEPKGIGGGAVDIAQADRLSSEFQQRKGGGTKSTTAQTPQNVMKQPESYTTDPGAKPDASSSTAQTPFSPYPHGYPPEGQMPGVRVPWDTLAGSPGHGSKTPGRSDSSKGSRSPDQSSASSKVPSNTATNPGSGSNEPSQAQLKTAYNEGCMVGRQVRNGELSSGAVKELMRTKYDQGHQALKNEFRKGWRDCQ